MSKAANASSPKIMNNKIGQLGALLAIPNISDLVRELVIGHTRPGLHKVYDQYAYLDEKRFALDAWAARLRTIIEPTPGNVVSVERSRV